MNNITKVMLCNLERINAIEISEDTKSIAIAYNKNDTIMCYYEDFYECEKDYNNLKDALKLVNIKSDIIDLKKEE